MLPLFVSIGNLYYKNLILYVFSNSKNDIFYNIFVDTIEVKIFTLVNRAISNQIVKSQCLHLYSWLDNSKS